MKKILFASLFSLSFLSQAQIDFRSTVFGVVAGGTYSRVRNAHNPSGPRFSVLGGVTAQVPVGYAEQFYIQGEVLYFGAGEGGDRKYEKAKGWDHAVYANNYLSVPLNFKAYFSEAESEFFGLIGPRFNFLINQKVNNVPAGRDYYDPNVSNPDYPNINGKANSFNLGIGAGVGYSYKRQLEIALKYDIGLSNAYPNLVESWTLDPSTQKKKSEQVISLGLTYFFQ